MISEKGELIFIVSKFKFSYHKLLQYAFKRLKCTKRGCKAFCNNENVVWASSNLIHNHDSVEVNKLDRHVISNELKGKTVEYKLLYTYFHVKSLGTLFRQEYHHDRLTQG